jgi:hypothetical protein
MRNIIGCRYNLATAVCNHEKAQVLLARNLGWKTWANLGAVYSVFVETYTLYNLNIVSVVWHDLIRRR